MDLCTSILHIYSVLCRTAWQWRMCWITWRPVRQASLALCLIARRPDKSSLIGNIAWELTVLSVCLLNKLIRTETIPMVNIYIFSFTQGYFVFQYFWKHLIFLLVSKLISPHLNESCLMSLPAQFRVSQNICFLLCYLSFAALVILERFSQDVITSDFFRLRILVFSCRKSTRTW